MKKTTSEKTIQIFKSIGNFSTMLGAFVLLIILGHYLIGSARFIKHTILGVKTGQALVEEMKSYPVFENFEGYPEYFDDLRSGRSEMLALPYYHWRAGEFKGKVVNTNADLNRHTIKQPKPNAKKIFMFGGSTMWGTGSPDQYTIPSQLQALLGSNYDVYNFGTTAYVSVQELNLLLEQLSKGFIPDIVIFYDGVNDAYAGMYSPARPRHPQFTQDDYKGTKTTFDHILALFNKTNYIALTVRMDMLLKKDPEGIWESKVMPHLEENAKETVDAYSHLIRQVKALGQEYGFKTYHIWQPSLLTEKRELTAFEKEQLIKWSPNLIKSYNTLYDLAKTELTKIDNFYYLADVFENTKEPIYFDYCHMGPLGNKIIAENIYKTVFMAQNKESS